MCKYIVRLSERADSKPLATTKHDYLPCAQRQNQYGSRHSISSKVLDLDTSATPFWGMLQEGMASGQALLDIKRDAGASELAKALVAEMETSAGRSATRDGVKANLTGKSRVEMRQQIIATLTRVGQILDAKAPDDAAGFKTWLKHIAERVAEASSEGGFLRFRAGGAARMAVLRSETVTRGHCDVRRSMSGP